MDRNVQDVIDTIKSRAEVGLHKYGVTTEREDLSEIEWLVHAQQEAMDLAIYLQVLINKYKEKDKIKKGN